MSGLKAPVLRGGYGNIRAAKFDYDVRTTHPVPSLHPVIGMHQAGTTYVGQFAQSSTPVSSEIPSALARAGFTFIAGEINGSIGGDGFGNASTMTDMEAARVRLGTFVDKNGAAICDNSKVHLVGFSMGLHACLRYAQLNPTKVASVTGVVGLADAMHTYDDVPAQQAAMRTAWGAADRTALAASGFNTLAGMAALNGVVPVQMFYSTADTVVLPITQTSVGALLGADLYPVSASLDHTAAEAIAVLVRDLVNVPKGYTGKWTSITKFMTDHN